jgi:hypothetical protein
MSNCNEVVVLEGVAGVRVVEDQISMMVERGTWNDAWWIVLVASIMVARLAKAGLGCTR